jgi:hypothetical protein
MKSIRVATFFLAIAPFLALAADPPAETKPAKEKEPKTQTTVNLSSPRDTLTTLLNAKFDGDEKACAATLYLPKEFNQAIVTEWAHLNVIPGRLRSAIIAKFSKDEKIPANYGADEFKKYLDAVKNTEIKIDGDTVTFPLGKVFNEDILMRGDDIVLVKIKDEWKIRLDTWLKMPAGDKSVTLDEVFKGKWGASMYGVYYLIEPIIADIESGKIKSMEEVEAAMKRNR